MQNASPQLKRTGSNKRTVALVVVAAAALLAVGMFLVAALWPIRSPLLKRRIETALTKASGAQCRLGSLTIRLFHGITIDGIAVRKTLDPNTSLSIHASSARLTYRFLPLIARLPALMRRRPAPDSGSLSPQTPATFSGRLSTFTQGPLGSVINALKLNGATVAYVAKGDTVFRCGDIRARLKLPDEDATGLTGRISIDTARISNWTLNDFSSPLELSGGVLSLSALSARGLGGRIKGRAAFDLDAMMIDSLSLNASKIDLRKAYLATNPQEGSVEGTAKVVLHMKRSAFALDSLAGHGNASVSGCVVEEMPIQRKLFLALVLPELSRLSFRKVTSNFTLSKGRIYLPDLRAEGEPLTFTSKGSFGFSGYLNQKVDGALSSIFLKTLAPVVRNSLKVDARGDGKFSCKIKGHIDNPVIVLDKKMLQRAVKSVFDEIGKEIGKYFD